MTRRRKIILICVPVAIALLVLLPMTCRYRANVNLGHELRKEADAWLATLPKIPPEENGAPGLMKALDSLEYLSDDYTRYGYRINNESDAEAFRDYLERNEETLSLVWKNLTRKKWAYTTNYEKGFQASIPNLLLLKNAANVRALRGDLAEFEGKKSGALKEYLHIFRLADTLSRERGLVSQMIQIAIYRIGLNRLVEIASEPGLPREDLSDTLRKVLETHEKRGNAVVVYETEYHVWIMYISDHLTGKSKGGISIPLTPGVGTRTSLGSWLASSRFLYNFQQDVDVFRRWKDICQTIEPAKYYSWPEELKDEKVLYGKIGLQLNSLSAVIAQIAIPYMTVKSAGVFASSETVFRGTIALLAIRLHQARNNALPESLDALGELVPKDLLIDPLSGKSLIYRREGDDFYLYSVGFNGKDDKCKDSRPIYEKDVNPMEVPDIIFHAPGANGK